MPKDKDEVVGEIAPDQARAIVAGHIMAHGRDQTAKIPKGSKWGTHDVPSQDELDADPDWHKHGGRLEDQPDGDD